MRRALYGHSVVLTVALVLAGCASWSSPGPPEDDLGPVGDFTLTERNGQTVRPADLAGKVWVAGFIFTRCAGPCAQVTGSMARLRQECADLKDFRLVSFTVDPEHDTPEVLRDYADRHGADSQRWLFLTGKPDDVCSLIRHGFHLTAKPNEGDERTPGNEIMHDTRLALVDRRGHIRGYFNGTSPDDLPRLREKITVLLRDKP
jgi:cytochrome oxidase Cu insertion factor (SCO1/SenC/PrrC family)